MRIVAGSAGGLRIKAPPGSARPTTERLRESVFSMIESMGAVDGAEVLDLFAGSGAMGIEALSRGAASAVFVDNDPRVAATIRSNLEATGFGPAAGSVAAEVVIADAISWIRRDQRTCDLVFCDPPYAFDRWGELLAGIEAGVVVAESDRPIGEHPGWDVLKVRRSGGTVVSVMLRKSK